MSLKIRYIIYSLLLHGIITYFIYRTFEERPLIFVGIEVLILISFAFTIWFFDKMMQPTRIIDAGTDALADKDFSVKFVDQGALEVDRLIELYNRMIDELRDERLRTVEQTQFLNTLIEASPVGIIILNFDNEIETLNPKATVQCQIDSDAIGKKLETFDSKLLSSINTIPENTSKLITIDGLQKYKCQVTAIIYQGFRRQFIMIEELTAEMSKTEKEAYGKVIRMMAHEVNNGTGAINSILSTILDYNLGSNPDEDTKNALRVAIERNEGLSLFIKRFADILRLPQPSKRDLNLNEFIKSVVLPWQKKGKQLNIEIVLEAKGERFEIHFDANQLDRVISNALKNSIESIGENGKIVVRTNAQNKSLAIIDNGTGISANVQEKLFTPFFSTKTNGQGIGLMLSREILQNHNAKLTLKSEGEWTTFRIVF